ncbi:unnamed protein product [Rotaria sp. Silwood2]|nr:unnamed protein product [Rotaria sp. Silwood2]CAF2743739.1 unnamed protein product [Rotaria sp. Silwood2]CAF2886462.1 unnamed protein product [Rotaria sp. Silwood2]CAF4035682.1 unnamed protein product [Rotaria sp. Silwood2]CAF4124923.1 unnamed protein product [Rotaria sp. Silwood2]
MRSSNGPSKLFVGDIGNNRKSDLNRLFSKYGEIATIYIDDNKRFAFVEFTSSNDAQRALRHTNNKTVNGSRLRVEYAKSDKISRDNRRPLSRERSPASLLYNHLQVTANRLPPMQAIRQSYYQYHPSTIVPNSTMSRGRSLTPPSYKQNARLSSMNHLRTQDFYPPYYPQHSTVYTDSAYYRAYGDPYLMQRLPPPTFLPPTSSSPPPPPPPPSSSSSSHAYRNMYSSSGSHRYPPVTSHRRTRRSRSRSGRRNSTSRKTRSSRERKRKRRTSSSSSSSSEEQRERGPQTPPSSNRTKKRSRSGSDAIASTSEQKSASSSSSEDETYEDKQSNSRKLQDNDSNQKHSKRKTRR